MRHSLSDKVEWLKTSLDVNQKTGEEAEQSVTLANLGTAYFDNGQIDKAIEVSQRALSIAARNMHLRIVAHALLTIGNCCSWKNDPAQATHTYNQLMEVAQAMQTWPTLKRYGVVYEMNALSALGIAYSQLGKQPDAMKASTKALHIARELRDPQSQAMALLNLGVDFAQAGKDKIALRHYEEALGLAREMAHVSLMEVVLRNLGGVLLRLGRKNKGKRRLAEAERLRAANPDTGTPAMIVGRHGGYAMNTRRVTPAK